MLKYTRNVLLCRIYNNILSNSAYTPSYQANTPFLFIMTDASQACAAYQDICVDTIYYITQKVRDRYLLQYLREYIMVKCRDMVVIIP